MKMKEKIIKVLLVLLCIGFVAWMLYGCTFISKPKGPFVPKAEKYEDSALSMQNGAFRSANAAAAFSFNAESEGAVFASKKAVADSAAANGTSSIPAGNQKKIIRNGNVDVEVESLGETIKAVESWVKNYGGYISSSSEYDRNIYFCVHIPSEKFDEAMNAAGNFGKILSKNISQRDVTEQYFDVETRLKNQKSLLEKLEKYLKDAKNINEIIQVESKISSATSEIERLEGQMKRLSSQIDYSQIDVSAQLPLNQKEGGFIFPDAKTEARKFAGNILSFLSTYIFTIFYVIIYGAFASALVIFVYWLAFGKVGIIRKIFDKIK